MNRRFRRILSLFRCAVLAFGVTAPTVALAQEDGEVETPTFAEVQSTPDGTKTIVSLLLDDNNIATAEWLAGMARTYGIRYSCMLIADRLNEATAARYRAVFADGYLEPQSHSYTHDPIPSAYWASHQSPPWSEERLSARDTAENYEREFRDSMTAIEGWFPDSRVLTFAASNNTLSTGAASYLRTLYYAVRCGNGGMQAISAASPSVWFPGVNDNPRTDNNGTATPGSWQNLSVISLRFEEEFHTDTQTTGEADIRKLDAYVAEGNNWFIGWGHAITADYDRREAERFYAYVKQLSDRGEVRCMTFSEATKYIREYQNSTVTATTVGNTITVDLTLAGKTPEGLPLSPDVFCVPLTVKVEVPAFTSQVQYRQGEGSTLTAQAFTEEGKRYVRMNLVPGAGRAVATVETHDAAPAILDALADCLVETNHLADDGYLGVPVDLYTYTKTDRNKITPVAMYVINTNTLRTGTEEDVSILRDLVEEYIVVVTDYHNHPDTTPVNLEFSTHGISSDVGNGKYLDGRKILKRNDSYILPAGYRLMRDIPYFNYEKHGVAGLDEYIIGIWNAEFRAYGNNANIVVTYPDGTQRRIGDITAEKLSDCVNRDGSPLDLNLYMDIIYPSVPANGVTVPVISMAISRQSTTGNFFANPQNPEYIGACLFEGYAAMLYEHAYTPMARADHYSYFQGADDSPRRNVFTLRFHTGIKASCAAIRCFRYMVDATPALSALSQDIGVICISKTAYNNFLSNEYPELSEEEQFLPGHHGECAEGTVQPYLYYEGHEGEEAYRISSRVQALYTCQGGGANYYDGNPACPVFVTDGITTSTYGIYAEVRRLAYQNDVPCVYYKNWEIGDNYIWGHDETYDVDTYLSVLNFFHHHLRGDGVSCEWILPLSGTEGIATDAPITVKFNGTVSRAEVEKNVRILCDYDGKAATGTWRSILGGTEWIFTPDGLRGGVTYTVEVTPELRGANGKQVANTHRATLSTVWEMSQAPQILTAGNATSLTVTDEVPVYVSFGTCMPDASDSYRLRFRVDHAAAQRIGVYAVQGIRGADVTNVIRGRKIATVPVYGAGEYTADISDYVGGLAAGEELSFALVGERKVGVTELLCTDFESSASYAGKLGNGQVTGEVNATPGGSHALKFDGKYYSFTLLNRATDADIGRLFHVSLKTKVGEGTHPQYTMIYISYNNSKGMFCDFTDESYHRLHQKQHGNSWMTTAFDYFITPSRVRAEDTSARQWIVKADAGVLYMDDVTVTEEVTPVRIDGAQLLTSPASDLTLTPTQDSTHVGGTYRTSANGGIGKTYVRYSLADLPVDGTVDVGVALSGTGRVCVWGLLPVAGDWSASVGWLDAPGNDRFGFGMDVAAVYGGTPLAILPVDGTVHRRVDVSAFARWLRSQGKQEMTLVFTGDATGEVSVIPSPGNVVSLLDFNAHADGAVLKDSTRQTEVTSAAVLSRNGSAQAAKASASHRRGTTGAGACLVFDQTSARSKFYNLFDRNLTAADVGKRYRVSFWASSDSEIGFRYGLMAAAGADPKTKPQGYIGTTIRPYTAASYTGRTDAGEWQYFTFDFTVDEIMLSSTWGAMERGTVGTEYHNPALLGFTVNTDSSAWENYPFQNGKIPAGKDNLYLYIDDILVTELPAEGAEPAVLTVANIADAATATPGTVGRRADAAFAAPSDGILLHLPARRYFQPQNAVLALRVAATDGKRLTLTTATGEVLGGLTPTAAGEYRIDLTDYLLAHNGEALDFILRSEGEAGTVFADVSLSAVGRVDHVFGYGNATAAPGTYTVEVTLENPSDHAITATAGFAAAGSDTLMGGGQNITLTEGKTQTFTLTCEVGDAAVSAFLVQTEGTAPTIKHLKVTKKQGSGTELSAPVTLTVRTPARRLSAGADLAQKLAVLAAENPGEEIFLCLRQDVTLTAPLVISGGLRVTLELNGYTLHGAGVTVEEGSTLTFTGVTEGLPDLPMILPKGWDMVCIPTEKTCRMTDRIPSFAAQLDLAAGFVLRVSVPATVRSLNGRILRPEDFEDGKYTCVLSLLPTSDNLTIPLTFTTYLDGASVTVYRTCHILSLLDTAGREAPAERRAQIRAFAYYLLTVTGVPLSGDTAELLAGYTPETTRETFRPVPTDTTSHGTVLGIRLIHGTMPGFRLLLAPSVTSAVTVTVGGETLTLIPGDIQTVEGREVRTVAFFLPPARMRQTFTVTVPDGSLTFSLDAYLTVRAGKATPAEFALYDFVRRMEETL